MKKHFLLLSILILVLFGSHFLINDFTPTPLKYTDIIISHALLALLSFGGVFLLYFMNDFDAEKVGLTFLSLSVVKMLFALSYILVQIHMFNKPNSLAISFLLVYFIHLVFLSIVTFGLVSNNNSVKKEE